MGNPTVLYPCVPHWHDLYKAALFETDKTRLPDRITSAEQAIVARARQLFDEAETNETEEQTLDDALYALRALKSCLRLNTLAA